MNSKVNNFLATSIIPFVYGLITIGILRELPHVGEIIFSLAIVIAVFKSYFSYKLNNTSLVIALAIVYGELILTAVSYVIPFSIAVLPLFGIISATGFAFRRYAKKIA